MKLKQFYIVIFLACVSLVVARPIAIPVDLQNATISFVVSDVKTGKNVLEHHSNQTATPASITKLVTTATALELLGGDFRFITTIAHDGSLSNGILTGNLYVIGSGDPTLGSAYFKDENFLTNWCEQLKKIGIKEISGNIIADARIYDDEAIPVRWTWEDMGNYYAAGVYGISLFDNTTRITLRSKEVGSTPEISSIEPQIPNLEIVNYLKSTNITFDSAYVYGMPYENHRYLRGEIPAHRDKFVIKGDIPNPPLFLAEQFKQELIKHTIAVKGLATDKVPPYVTRTTLFEHQSPRLGEICKITNFVSNNNFAEHIFKHLALQRSPLATNTLAKDVILNFWQKKGINTQSVSLNDGSGLSPMNGFSANFLNEILCYMMRSKNSHLFLETIPRAGTEGTVKNFLNDKCIKSTIRAKSGSMKGVQTYAGYIQKTDAIYSFCVIINNYNGSRTQVRKTIEHWLSPIIK